MISCTCAEWIAALFCRFKCFCFIFAPSGGLLAPPNRRVVCLHIFDSINLNLMTFVSNQTHTVTHWDQHALRSPSQTERKRKNCVSFLLHILYFIWFHFIRSFSSRCYHFIIRLKKPNKNKSLMLCFTLLSIANILISCSVKPLNFYCWCSSWCWCFCLVLLIALIGDVCLCVHRYAMNWCESKPQSE